MTSTTLKGFKKEIEYEKITISGLRKLDSGGQMSSAGARCARARDWQRDMQ